MKLLVDALLRKPEEDKKPDYYSILGVERNATLAELKKAYRQDPQGSHAKHYERMFFQRAARIRVRSPDVLVR